MKLCLCGSTQFMDQFHQAAVALTLKGHVVYTVATSVKGDFKPTDEQKMVLDAVHLRKVFESDAVIIIGRREDGSVYLGESTKRELMFATLWGKDIGFWDPEREVVGPYNDFQAWVKEASITDSQRKEEKAKELARQREMMEKMGMIRPGHTGTADCPECAKEEATEKACH